MAGRRHDPERVIDLDLVRCTENAALTVTAWKWFGKGEKEKADGAAAGGDSRHVSTDRLQRAGAYW